MLIFQPLFVLVFFVFVRSADLSITYGIAHSWLRCLAYALAALFALVALILLIGVK